MLLESLVARLNERARRKVPIRFIKVPAHQGHPLNELANAAASRAAVDGDEEATAVSHADNRAVRFVFEQRLTEWGAGLRPRFAATQLRDRLTSRARQEAGSTDRIDGRSQRNRVSLAAQWMLRPKQGRASLGSAKQGRASLGSAMAYIRYGSKWRRLMQTIAGMLPCKALLQKWGR